MTKDEKELLYNLLKTASSALYGYSSPDFKENINFEEKPQTKITIESIAEKIKSCVRCELCKTRTNTVPGFGVKNPYVLVLGEGPGEEEDKEGLPFVGPAGKLLDKMLSSINLSRNANCFITNVVKCRPPFNRDPKKEERDACKSFLDAQIQILKPKYILAFGKVALRNLFNIEGEFSLTQYRGRILEYNSVPMAVTYHPSALLRNPEYKRPAWEDLKFFRAELEKNYPEYKESFVPNF